MSVWAMVVLISVGAILSVWLLIALFQTGKPLRSILGSALQGACALAAVNVTGAFTGVSLGLNWLSGVACGALGVPGVIGLLILKVIFRM